MCDACLLQRLIKKENNQELKKIITIYDSTEKFKKLISIRSQVDRTAYAMYVRMAIQMDTHGVPLEILLEALKGLEKEDLMSKKEIKKLKAMPDILTIYRGTDAREDSPRISWSLSEKRARIFAHGQMYKADVNKHDIYAYFSENSDEEEIIAHVTDNYEKTFFDLSQ